MPRDPADGGPGTPGSAVGVSDRPALARLVGDVAAFADATWARSMLHRPSAQPGGFADLLTEEGVDELLARRGLRTPFVRVAKGGTTSPSSAFTAPGGVGAGIGDQVSDDKLSALFGAGSTIVLQGLHRVWPPVIDFCQQLAADLGHPVQANAYVTPPQNRGFDDHYDVHDVFVLQVAGRKKWCVRAPVLPSPLRDQPWTDRREAVGRAAEQEPLLETVLEPGDVLYLPRGYLHSATALGGVTVHLTLGVHAWTRFAVAEDLLALALQRLADDEWARGSLRMGTALDTGELPLDAIRERLVEALEDVRADDVSDRVRARRRDSQRPAPIGPLAQHALAASVADDTVVRLRAHLDARVVDGRIVSRAGAVAVDQAPEDAVARLVAGETVAAADLGLEVARALIEAGVVVGGA